jgi:hypothetical protein
MPFCDMMNLSKMAILIWKLMALELELGVFTFPPFLEEQLLILRFYSPSHTVYIYYILYMWYVISSLKPWHFFLVQGQCRAFSHFSRPSLTPRDGQHPRRLCLWCFSCSVAMNDLQKHEARPILVSGGFFNMGEKIQPRLMTGRSGRFFESLKIQQYTPHGIRWYKHIPQINPTHFFWYNRTVLCFFVFPYVFQYFFGPPHVSDLGHVTFTNGSIPNGDKVHSVIITSGEEGLEKPISILGSSSWGYFLWSFMNINQFKDGKLNPQKLRYALYFSVELHQAVSSAAEFCICLIYIHILLHG